ncbi:neuroendocrine convertase 1-like [Paramacrobiotus metropolitanus]|uniref:neuroendocrine convertase 1-like n=1 Tax=Paramacrobiotus metropolitanus TaxID=2943436 RepID=UPI002445FD56|nr:neuroendocrine convertase 1-like [Paramacrobiotus metropolitanus]
MQMLPCAMMFFPWIFLSVMGNGEFINEWLVEIPGGLDVAQQVAKEHGFIVVKELPELPKVFQFKRLDNTSHTNDTFCTLGDSRSSSNTTLNCTSLSATSVHRSKRKVPDSNPIAAKLVNKPASNLERDTRIKWAEQQKVLVRTKRDYQDTPKLFFIDDNDNAFSISSTDTRSVSLPASNSAPDAEAFNDPLWATQWYLHQPSSKSADRNMRALQDSSPISLQVAPVWQKEITGKGVVVTILDDGLESNHSDLAVNYDAEASTNINGNNRNPTPRYENPEDTHHGTRCAGEVAMQANNNVCGVGIAYDARIGGVRMLDGTVTDRVEAESFSFNNDYIDIYSSSWGPSDNGRTVEKPGSMAARALEKGVKEGRQGKGSLYVWASGNGGINGDSCAYDGYASNINTLSVGSTTEYGHVPIYAEQCPSTMACTCSSGSYFEGKIVSTDLLNRCTSSHTGTSASAPLAAAIVALLLEANNNLTWRDVKHLVAWTANPFPLLHTPGWYVNGVGMLVHPIFGFGLMDAAKLVQAGQLWETVPEKTKCAIRKAGIENALFSHNESLVVPVTTRACRNTVNEIRYLEHVEVIVSLSHLRRGVVQIYLESPMGTRTLIAPKRRNDLSTNGFVEWPFLSVHNWGENPYGTWKVTFESQGNNSQLFGALQSLKVVFHGTKEEPKSTGVVREMRRQQTSDALQQADKEPS